MKKIAAILLISIFIFNVIGYKWMFSYMENKATARLEQKINAGQYSDDQLLEIKIPISVPYYTSTQFETYYGETQFNGEHYRYVKRKISGDTLYLLCLPHTEKDNIAAAKNNFINSVNDLQNNNTPQKQGHSSLIKILMSKYVQQEIISAGDLQIMVLQNLHSSNSYLISQFDPQTVAQPPECV
ncbi:MAG: hypothetical protein ABUT20_22055 [Bacteroidota bacterium]